MRPFNAGRLMVAWGLLATGSMAADAGEPARTMSGLEQRLKAGQEIAVIDRDGRLVEGHFVRADGEGLVVDLYGNAQRRVAADDLVSVDRRGDSSANGVLIGAAAGAAVGLVFGLTPMEERYTCSGHSNNCYAWCVTDACRRRGGAIVAALGIAIGFAVDRHEKGLTAVYRAPVARMSWAVTPEMVPQGGGVRVALRF